MKQKARARSRERYQANAVELSKRFIYGYSENIILKGNKELSEEMKAKYAEFPYEVCVRSKMNKLLTKYHICKNEYLYDECISISHIAYMYSIAQCVIHKKIYIKGYINKMLPIFIKCQMRVSIDLKKKECNYVDTRKYTSNSNEER